jgi:signal transduction histidine kinase
VVRETTQLLRRVIGEDIELVTRLAEDAENCKLDPDQLTQVILNLAVNARDAMPQGGMLEVRTAAHNGTVEVEVADTGNGISREYIHKIFDPFFTTKGGGRGTGLGLSVSYGIIKEHAGKIDVRSTPGRGTSFHVEFPAVRKAVHV